MTKKTNTVYERHQFFKIECKSDQSVDAYILKLKKQAAKCAFHAEEHDKLIRDRLVWGIRNTQLQEELLRDSELTLLKAVNQCEVWETSKREVANINDGSTLSSPVVPVDRVNKFNDNRRDNRNFCSPVSSAP